MNTTSQWRLSRNLIEEYQTPSGLVIRAKKVEILSLVEQGLIPTPLLAVADQVVEGKSAVELSEFREFMPLVAAVVKAAVVYPKIVDEPVAADDDTKVGIDELSFADKMAVFEWSIDGGEVMGGKLKKFFREVTD